MIEQATGAAPNGREQLRSVRPLGAPSPAGPTGTPGPPPVDAVGHVRITLSDEAYPVWAARHAVTDECEGRLPASVVADLRLVVSELVANVIEHGEGARGVVVDLTFSADGVDLRVAGCGDPRLVPPCEQWSLPPATRRTGRGLALVRQLSRSVTVDRHGAAHGRTGWLAITASLPVSPA